MMLAAG